MKQIFIGPFPASFLYSNFSIQLAANKICWWLNLNCGSQVTEVTAQPTVPQPQIEWLLLTKRILYLTKPTTWIRFFWTIDASSDSRSLGGCGCADWFVASRCRWSSRSSLMRETFCCNTSLMDCGPGAEFWVKKGIEQRRLKVYILWYKIGAITLSIDKFGPLIANLLISLNTLFQLVCFIIGDSYLHDSRKPHSNDAVGKPRS